ncbi:MAG: hypothetical protein U0359_34940 [Byssovorax sp.]
MDKTKIREALVEVVADGEAVLATAHKVEFHTYIDGGKSRQWVGKMITVLRSAFGEDGDLYRMAQRFEPKAEQRDAAVSLHGIAKSALDVWDKGYIFDVRRLAEANVEASLMDQAQALLAGKYHQAAAVLAGAVLEHHLRSVAAAHGISEADASGRPKTMNPLNIDLCKAGVYDAMRRSHIDSLATIRNAAAHGNAVDADDAKRLVGDVLSLCDKIK